MEQWEPELAGELAAAAHGDRTAVIRRYESITGLSATALWRRAKAAGYTTPRAKRSDAGECTLSDDQIAWVAGLIHTSRREIKGAIMPVEDALRIAEDNGIIEKGCISPARMAAILRERGASAAHLSAPTPHTQLRSLHPNHVHVFDVSVCIQYYLRAGGMMIMDERNFYKNKPDNYKAVKNRLMRYVLADHFSGAAALKYYYAAGETQAILFDFLMSAWGKKIDERNPFRGVPFMVMMDAGAANTSRAMLALMERMGIEIPKSMPHNPRRQGIVENLNNIVERKFESRLRFQPAHNMDDLNAWADDWAAWFNSLRHSRHGMSRIEAWSQIQPAQLRELPPVELLRQLFATPEETRRVSGRYSISYQGREYDVRHIPGVIPHRTDVSVTVRPFDFPEITVRFNRQEYAIKPVETVAGGFREDAAIIGQEYKAAPHSITQRVITAAEHIAYGETGEPLTARKRAGAQPYAGIRVMGIHSDKITTPPRQVSGIPHAAGTLDALSAEMERRIPISDLFRRLAPLMGTITPDQNQSIRRKYGTSVTLSEASRITDAARSGHLDMYLDETSVTAHSATGTDGK